MLSSFILETSVAPGTATTINLAGAALDRRTFASAFATGSNVFYFMDDGTQAEWGIGVSTTSSPNTLSRNTVLGNTAGTTSRLNFTGTVRVYNEVPGGRMLFVDGSGNVTTTGNAALNFLVALNLSGLVTANAGVVSTAYDAGGANFRATYGGYGVMLRVDGSSAYLLQTANGTPLGSFNSFRPFSWSLSTGAVVIDGTGAGATFGGAVSVTGTLGVAGALSAASATVGGTQVVTNGGTWNINVLGNAATATSAGTVPWSGVSSKPYIPNQGVDTGSAPTFAGLTVAGNDLGNGVLKLSSGATWITFGWNGANVAANVAGIANVTFQNATSDYRLKEDIAPAEAAALPIVERMAVRDFRFRTVDGWKSDGKRHIGFIAHELAEVLPCAVIGDKDAVTEDGRMLPQSVNTLPLLALLAKGEQEMLGLIRQQAGVIQELTARVAALEARA